MVGFEVCVQGGVRVEVIRYRVDGKYYVYLRILFFVFWLILYKVFKYFYLDFKICLFLKLIIYSEIFRFIKLYFIKGIWRFGKNNNLLNVLFVIVNCV